MANFGETLKRERELREISLRQISEATKIALRYLEALEENRFDALPGGLFNKGFIRAYAAYIGIDGEAMVNSYLQEAGVRQKGPESLPPSRSTPTMHRPQGSVARRAGAVPPQRPAGATPQVPSQQRPEASSKQRPPASSQQRPAPSHVTATKPPAERPQVVERASGPAIPGESTAPAAPRKSKEIRAVSSLEAVEGGTGRPARSASETNATLAALEKILDQRPHHPAVSGIENADAEGPPASRLLVWVLSFVAAAGVLFLVVSLVRGSRPGAGHVVDRPEASGTPAPANPSGTPEPASPESARAPVTQETQGIVPEVTAQSPLILGAAGGPPAANGAGANGAGAANAGAASGAAVKAGTATVGSATGPVAGAAAPGGAAASPPPKPKTVRQSPLPPPLTAPGADDRPAEAPPAAGVDGDPSKGPMRVVLEARGKTYVVLSCDGQEVVNRIMDDGESEKAKCDTVLRVSAGDAGAVSLSINGGVCLPLGDPGTRAYGYTIRIDDYTRICPPLGGGRHGRR